MKPERGKRVERHVSRRIATPLGPMLAAATPRGVCFLEFVGPRNPRAMRAVAPGESRHLDRLERELAAYFAGRLRRFAVPLDLGGMPFQQSVWKSLRRVNYGDTLTYAQLAVKAGRGSAVRAAGHANGRNPVSIVVPCHRVVGTDGTLHGYGGGLWRKRRLLELEREGASFAASTSAWSSSPRSSKKSRRARRSGP